MSERSHLGHVVYRNHDNADVYRQRIEAGLSPVQQVFPLDAADLRTQFIARSIGGGEVLGREPYQATFGTSIDEDFGLLLRRLHAAELIDDDGRTIVLSELGKLVYDLVTLAFYPKTARDWLAQRQLDATTRVGDVLAAPISAA